MRLESLQMGCVSYGEAFFPDGQLNNERFDAAYHRARSRSRTSAATTHREFWQEAVGSSGTLRAIEGLIVTAGWREDGIDRDSLTKLRKKTSRVSPQLTRLTSLVLARRVKGVVTAGLAITMAIFDGLQISLMRNIHGALREGVIYDLIGRFSHETSATARFQPCNSATLPTKPCRSRHTQGRSAGRGDTRYLAA